MRGLILILTLMLSTLSMGTYANALIGAMDHIAAHQVSERGERNENKVEKVYNAHRSPQSLSIIIFFKGTCPYCQRFAPILKHYARVHHLRVFAYSIDGLGLKEYPHPLTTSAHIAHMFFGHDPTITVPATFLVNTHTLDAWPIAKGFENEGQFSLDVERAILKSQGPSS